MVMSYRVFVEGNGWIEVEFDDQKTVNQLARYVLEMVECFEPFGEEILTLFEAHSPKSSSGWFIIDSNQTCAESITNPKELCLAYHLPGKFYFVEGGWGHHMPTLGNHPALDTPVSFKLSLDDFRNMVVVSGKYTFREMINMLLKVGYISTSAHEIIICYSGMVDYKSIIQFQDDRVDKPIYAFIEEIEDNMPAEANYPVISFT